MLIAWGVLRPFAAEPPAPNRNTIGIRTPWHFDGVTCSVRTKSLHIAKPDIVLEGATRSRCFCLRDKDGVWGQQLDEAVGGGHQNCVFGANTPQQVVENTTYALCPVPEEIGADLVVECRQVSPELVTLVRDWINEDVYLLRIGIGKSHHHARPGGVCLRHEAKPRFHFLLRQP